MAKRARFDTLRSIAFGGISGVYAAIGTSPTVTVNARILCFTNTTNAAVIISDDNTNADGKIIVPAGGFKLFDLTSDLNVGKDDNFVFAAQTTFYVKQVSAPGSGSVYLEVIYG